MNYLKPIFLSLVFSFVFFKTTLAQSNTKEFKPTKNMVELNVLEGKASLKKGQKAYIQYTQHSSVGIDGELSISDNSLLKTIEKQSNYVNKQEKGMTGNDKATITVVLEALKAGEVTVTLTEIFRGKTEAEHTIKITIK